MRQLKLFGGEKARDRALERIRDGTGEWFHEAFKAAARSRGMVEELFTGEDLRVVVRQWCGDPHHHNAWGALVRELVKEKVILPVGSTRPMKVSRSHARRTPVYRWGVKG